jgi:hypothetical protein
MMKHLLTLTLILLLSGCASSTCVRKANALVREAENSGLESGVIVYRPFDGCKTLHAGIWINYENKTGYYDCDTGKRMPEPVTVWAVFDGEWKTR